MALQIGDTNATSGMSKAIYDQFDALLSPPLAGMPPADLEKVRTGWRQLAYAIAKGVVEHIKTNMEISGIQTTGSVNVNVTGTVSGSSVTGTGTGTVNTTQSGPTTGHVQ
jgi:hypothetical protein